jgi:4-hydroxy-3-methylbut-2-enyl diphosphate reductase
LSNKHPVSILITSGASCPDALVEGVIKKLISFFPDHQPIEDLIKGFNRQIDE